jgi:thiol-disulfide isomerase/thioredoxin
MIYLIVGIVIILCIIISFYLYKRFNKSKTQQDTPVNTADLYYFYTTWCPYCTKARPEWNKFKAHWNNKKKNGYTLLFSEIDCDKNESLSSKYEVETYPCIKLIKDGKIYDYDAKPTIENLNTFVNSCMD